MQYNYYSLYNITEARASDKHLARIEKAADDQRFATQMSGLRRDLDVGAYRNAKQNRYEPEAAEYLRSALSNAADTKKNREKLHNLDSQGQRLKTHIRDRKGEQGEKPVPTDRQQLIKAKVAENKARLRAEAAENKARLKAAAKKKAAQHKTKIQQHGRKQKVGAALVGGGLAGGSALLKSSWDDVTG